MRLDVAVEAALDFSHRLLEREAQLDFDRQLGEPLRQLGVCHLHPRRRAVVVTVTPRVHADLRAHEIHPVRGTLVERNPHAVIVNRDRRLVSMLYRPDDVLRPPRRVAAEKNTRLRAREGLLVDDGHVLVVESDSRIALDPRERILLADGEDNGIARENDGLEHLALLLSILLGPAQPVHLHPDELSLLHDTSLWGMVLDDLDAFFFRVLELPRRGLEVRSRTSRDDLDVLAAQPSRCPAAIH